MCEAGKELSAAARGGWGARASVWVSGRALRLLALALCGLHVVLVLCHYPLAAVWSEHPLVGGDLTLHFAPAHLGWELRNAGGRLLWGYLPQFMAGYPFGAWDSFTQRGYEYCTLLFPGLSVAGAFNAYVILSALLPPFLVGLAARALRLESATVWLSLAAAVVVYQAGGMLTFFWTFGNVGFPLVNALAVLYLACAWRAVDECRAGYAAAAGLLLAAVGWLHQMAALPAAAGSLLLAAAQGRALFRGRRLLYALAIPVLALALLAPWLGVLWRFRHWRVPRETPALRSGWRHLVMDLFSDRGYRQHFDRRTLFQAQLVLTALGAWGAADGARRTVRWLAATAAAALAFAYLFSYSEWLKETEPYRYTVSFALLAIVPAAAGLRTFGRWWGAAGPAARAATAVALAAWLPSVTAYGFDLLQRRPMGAPDAETLRVLAWFRTQAERGGRVLCYDDALGDLLPAYSGLEVLGGAMTRCSPLAHRAAWMRARDFLRDERALAAPAEFAAYLRQYNIAYLVVPTRRLDAYLGSLPGVSLCLAEGRYGVFRTEPGGWTYVLGGPADARPAVRAGPNRIRIKGAPAGRFTLKYHYLDTLEAPAGVRLFPAPAPRDPAPFIGVDNAAGLSSFEIVNTGRLF